MALKSRARFFNEDFPECIIAEIFDIEIEIVLTNGAKASLLL